MVSVLLLTMLKRFQSGHKYISSNNEDYIMDFNEWIITNDASSCFLFKVYSREKCMISTHLPSTMCDRHTKTSFCLSYTCKRCQNVFTLWSNNRGRNSIFYFLIDAMYSTVKCHTIIDCLVYNFKFLWFNSA